MSKVKKERTNAISLSIIFSLISMGLFLTKTITSYVGKASAEGASDLVKFVVLPLLIVFAICFAVMVIYNIKDARAVKQNISDTKYAVKTTKNVAAIMEAVMEIINVVMAIVIAYGDYANTEIHWWNFRYYFTMIILIYTFLTTVYFVIKKVFKIKKSTDKRKAAQAKAEEKQIKAEERQKQIEAATAEKARKEAERAAAEKAAMPKKDQSHKAVKKVKK